MQPAAVRGGSDGGGLMFRTKHLVAIAATALSLGAFAAGATAIQPQGDGPGCEDGYACAWSDTGFRTNPYKWKVSTAAYYWHLDSGPGYSAKNRFGNRKVQLLRPDGSVVSCLDPGEDRPGPGPFHWMFVGDAGTRSNNCPATNGRRPARGSARRGTSSGPAGRPPPTRSPSRRP